MRHNGFPQEVEMMTFAKKGGFIGCHAVDQVPHLCAVILDILNEIVIIGETG